MHLREADRLSNDHGAMVPLASRSPRPSSQHRLNALSNDLYSAAHDPRIADANTPSHETERSVLIRSQPQRISSLYTPEQRRRRDATRWTLVQGILAPLQFAVFALSAFLVLRYLATGADLEAATASIVVKTALLYTIMITGAIWEREVFGVYLFAPAFFWEDVFSFLVLALHTAYLVALAGGLGDPRQQMLLALAAYAAYVVNATQFVLKLRAARRDERLTLLQGSAS